MMHLDFKQRPLRWFFFGGNDPATRPVRLAQGVLLLLLAVVVIFLFRADKPWSPRILERLEEGRNLSLKHLMTVGLYAAAVINGFALTVLYATARWWALPFATGKVRGNAWVPRTRTIARLWWTVLLLAVLAAGFLRWNLAHGSLWWDEAWNLTRAVHGEWVPDPNDDRKVAFQPRGWDRAFFYYSKPTNHVVFSFTSKISLTIWRTITGAAEHEFDEFIFRLPNFLAALAAVAALGFLLRDWGYPGAGLAAAWLLAIHPWHIRYGVDARAFSKVALISIIACFLLTRALRSGKWKYWIGFGLSLFLLLWAFPYAIYLALTLVACAVLITLTDRQYPPMLMLGRCLVSLCLGGMLFLQMMGPNILHIPGWDGIEGHGRVGMTMIPEMAASLVSGMPWWDVAQSSGTDGIPNLRGLTMQARWPGMIMFWLMPLFALAGFILLLIRRNHENWILLAWLAAVPLSLGPWPDAAVLWALPIFAILGVVLLLRTSGYERWVLLAWLMAMPVAICFAWGKTHYFYPRYVIYGLPAFLVAVAVALEILPRFFQSYRLRSVVTVLLVVGVPLAFLGATTEQRDLLRNRSYSPVREVAEFLEEIAGDDPHSILACGFGLGGDTPRIYYPSILYANDRKDLIAMMQRSRVEDKPLYLFYAYSSFNRVNQKKAFPLLDDESLFERISEFHGIESQFRYEVFLYTGKEPTL